MSAFPTIPLGEVTTKVGSGSTPRGGETAYKSTGTPLIRSMNVHFDGFREDGLAHIDDEQANALRNVEVRARDVLLNITGASIGRVTVAPHHMDGARVNQHVCIIRPDTRLEPSFLRWFLASPHQQRLINSMESGATRQALTKEKVLGFEVPLPSLDEQREIVAELEKQFSRLDEAVANLQRVKANLKRYKASVLKAAVEGRLVETEATLARREGRTYETGEQLWQRVQAARKSQWTGRGKYKEPEPVKPEATFTLPDGWCWATLEQLHLQIADVDHKMPKAVDGGIPYVSTKDFFGDEGINFDAAKRISLADFNALSRKVRPENGDILLSRYGTVGEVRLVTTSDPFQASYSVAILKPVRGLIPVSYLASVLRSDVVMSQIKRDVRATAQPDLGLAHIRQFVIPLPPLTEQTRIVAEVDRNLSIIREVEAEVDANLQRAQALRNAVLSRAFSNEVSSRVSSGRNGADGQQLVVEHSSRSEPASVAMAARILSDLAGEPTMGRVKLQKILYLATYHGKVDAANAEYVRMQAGPLDMPMLEGVIKRLNDLGWFREIARNGKSAQQRAYSYTPLTKAEEHKKHLVVLTTDQINVIDQMVRLMRTWSTEQCELLATVYGAWNDLIIWRRPPTVDAIVHEVLENWHEAKRKFSRQKISQMIEEIKRLGIEPSGFGLPTSGSMPDVISKSLFES